MKVIYKFFVLFGLASLIFFISFIGWIVFSNWNSINKPNLSWGAFSGPQLWEAVNNKRQSLGNNPLAVDQGLCSLASIRLGQLLEKNKDKPIGLGSLDNHEGLKPAMSQLHIPSDGKVGEFLTYAADPQMAVSNWLNTLGHKQLLTDSELKKGCAYAQNGFGIVTVSY